MVRCAFLSSKTNTHYFGFVPPRWRYVELHNVQLPDEYDRIWSDLEPFWGYSPTDLLEIQAEREDHKDTFTLGKNETSDVSVLKVSFSAPMEWDPQALLGGADHIIELLKDVQHHLPPFRAVISPHDSPTLFTDYEIKKTALDAALRGGREYSLFVLFDGFICLCRFG